MAISTASQSNQDTFFCAFVTALKQTGKSSTIRFIHVLVGRIVFAFSSAVRGPPLVPLPSADRGRTKTDGFRIRSVTEERGRAFDFFSKRLLLQVRSFFEVQTSDILLTVMLHSTVPSCKREDRLS